MIVRNEKKKKKKNIDPTMTGKCNNKCPQYYVGVIHVRCQITKHFEKTCVPYLLNEIDRLKIIERNEINNEIENY
jgi:hypothetical protein